MMLIMIASSYNQSDISISITSCWSWDACCLYFDVNSSINDCFLLTSLDITCTQVNMH